MRINHLDFILIFSKKAKYCHPHCFYHKYQDVFLAQKFTYLNQNSYPNDFKSIITHGIARAKHFVTR